MTTEEFLALCKSCKLSVAEMDELNVGTVIDYLYHYTDMKKQEYGVSDNNRFDSKIRNATQADFNAF